MPQQANSQQPQTSPARSLLTVLYLTIRIYLGVLVGVTSIILFAVWIIDTYGVDILARIVLIALWALVLTFFAAFIYQPKNFAYGSFSFATLIVLFVFSFFLGNMLFNSRLILYAVLFVLTVLLDFTWITRYESIEARSGKLTSPVKWTIITLLSFGIAAIELALLLLLDRVFRNFIAT